MDYKIPLFDLNFDDREETAVIETLRSRWISTGPQTTRFEEIFSSLLGVKHAIALSNCTVALHLAMVLMEMKDGDEVICPSLTFVATVNAIKYVRAKPVFCDITGPEDLTMDPARIEQLITPATKGIVVMHYGGFACNMERISAIAARHNLFVLEDSCHGPLSEYQGKKLGTIGEIGCFSFFSNKNISTGEGGMLVTNSDELAKRARLLRSHGMTSLSYERSKGHSTAYDVVDLGYNYRMDDIHASIGLVQLEKLPGDLKKRETIREYYIEKLQGIPGVIIPFKNNREFCSNYIFPIVLDNFGCDRRDSVRDGLHARGIQTSVHYPPVHLFQIYRDDSKPLPVTESVAENLITLPMYANLSFEDIDYISSSFNELLCR
jgi:dTDP-4-amino-4,6-dideoxygalactose transaminase